MTGLDGARVLTCPAVWNIFQGCSSLRMWTGLLEVWGQPPAYMTLALPGYWRLTYWVWEVIKLPLQDRMVAPLLKQAVTAPLLRKSTLDPGDFSLKCSIFEQGDWMGGSWTSSIPGSNVLFGSFLIWFWAWICDWNSLCHFAGWFTLGDGQREHDSIDSPEPLSGFCYWQSWYAFRSPFWDGTRRHHFVMVLVLSGG